MDVDESGTTHHQDINVVKQLQLLTTKQPLEVAASSSLSHHNHGAGDSAIDRTNLIVNYIPQTTSERELSSLFTLAGDLDSVKIMRHPRTGYSYGYGFVKYRSEDGALRAIELFNRFQFRNKTLKVSFSRPASQVTKNANLYISNLPKHIDEKQLQMMFGKFGEIIQTRVLSDKATGAPKGVAFVRYAKGEDAQRAIGELNGWRMMNAQYPLRVRIADDFSQQRAAHLLFATNGMPSEQGFPRNMGLPHFHATRAFMQLRNQEIFNYQRHLGGGDQIDWMPHGSW